MSETPRQIGAELLRDLSDKLSALAQQMLGAKRAQAEDFAEEVAWRVAADWGGQIVYIPMDLIARLSGRNAQIYKEFTGDNASELASKYGLSVQQIYRIIKRERAKRMPKQHSLFGG